MGGVYEANSRRTRFVAVTTKEVLPESVSPRTDTGCGTWTIAESVILGIAGLVLFLSTFFVVVYRTRLDSMLPADAFGKLLFESLVSLLVGSSILGPITLYIARRNGIPDFWASIEWNATPGVVRYVVIGAVLAILYRLTLRITFGSSGSFLAYRHRTNLLLYVAVVVLLQPAIEEIYFRGILFVGLERRLRTLPAIVIVTAVFALFHPRYQFYVLPVAIALGVLRVKTRSVAACFVLHASYNLFIAIYQIAFPS